SASARRRAGRAPGAHRRARTRGGGARGGGRDGAAPRAPLPLRAPRRRRPGLRELHQDRPAPRARSDRGSLPGRAGRDRGGARGPAPPAPRGRPPRPRRAHGGARSAAATRGRVVSAGEREGTPRPAPGRPPLSYATASAEEREALDALRRELDLGDPRSVLFFGSRAQQQLGAVSDRLLEGVRTRDADAAGGALAALVATLRGFDPGALDPTRRSGLVGRLLGRSRSI